MWTGESHLQAVVVFNRGQRTVFVAGLAKNDRPTFTDEEEAVYKELAETILGFTDGDMDAKVAAGAFREIERREP
ncbi:hypothetical protein BH11ARM2_BH11ARM2_29780 [soil metagenome]